jgi:hypothetical protein
MGRGAGKGKDEGDPIVRAAALKIIQQEHDVSTLNALARRFLLKSPLMEPRLDTRVAERKSGVARLMKKLNRPL